MQPQVVSCKMLYDSEKMLYASNTKHLLQTLPDIRYPLNASCLGYVS